MFVVHLNDLNFQKIKLNLSKLIQKSESISKSVVLSIMLGSLFAREIMKTEKITSTILHNGKVFLLLLLFWLRIKHVSLITSMLFFRWVKTYQAKYWLYKGFLMTKCHMDVIHKFMLNTRAVLSDFLFKWVHCEDTCYFIWCVRDVCTSGYTILHYFVFLYINCSIFITNLMQWWVDSVLILWSSFSCYTVSCQHVIHVNVLLFDFTVNGN